MTEAEIEALRVKFDTEIRKGRYPLYWKDMTRSERRKAKKMFEPLHREMAEVAHLFAEKLADSIESIGENLDFFVKLRDWPEGQGE